MEQPRDIGNFNKDYIKTEIFPKECRRRIIKEEEIRHASDYNDFYVARKQDAIQQIETAEELVVFIEKYISQNG